MAHADPPKPRLIRRLEAQRQRHRQRPFFVRAMYALAGFVVLLAGLAMLITPGPAFVVIPIGLALLSLDFAWAEQLLEKALRQGEIARRRAARTTRTQRTLGTIVFLLVAGGLLIWGSLGDIPLLPL